MERNAVNSMHIPGNHQHHSRLAQAMAGWEIVSRKASRMLFATADKNQRGKIIEGEEETGGEIISLSLRRAEIMADRQKELVTAC